jgi:hypothetical protein
MRRLLGGLLIAAAALGCGTRMQRETVFDQDRTQVELRHETLHGESVPRGFAQPAVIAPARLASILSSIDLREGKEEGERRPAIPTESLYLIAEGVSRALAKAGPDQEVAVLSIRDQKRFGVFDRKYLTSFVTYVKGEQLYVYLSRSEWEIPSRKADRLPQPYAGEQVMSFRVLAAPGLSLVGAQAVAADWRNPRFGRPTRAELRPDGKVVRRTVLMESPSEPEAAQAPEALPQSLSPAALRQLADLEEQRRRGELTESYYETRRREILAADAPAPR